MSEEAPTVPVAQVAPTENFVGEPAYSLIIHSGDTNLVQGSDFEFDVYISGAGDVDCAKIQVFIPPHLAESISHSPADGVDTKVKVRYRTYTEPGFVGEFVYLEQNMYNSFNIPLPIQYFTKTIITENDQISEDHLMVEGEMDKSIETEPSSPLYAPLSFHFKIAKRAPAGDHNIFLHLTYRSSKNDISKWHSENTILKIHVRQWYEKDIANFAVYAVYITAIYALVQLFILFYGKLIDP